METAREFQIEFERRIQLIDDEFIRSNKLNSDTIFTFLNAATERFVKLAYLQKDKIDDNTRAQKKNADAIKGLIVRKTLYSTIQSGLNTDSHTKAFILPSDYCFYIRSNSQITQSYKDESTTQTKIVPNVIISEDDVDKVISTAFNNIILRHPMVVLNAGNADQFSETSYINVIHDSYTNISTIDLVYCRKPKKFNVLNVDGKDVLDHCELPENVHMDIIELAVEMFVTEAKYRLNVKQD